MKNKNVLVWLLVAVAVAGAVFIGYTYRGTFLQGKMGRDGKGSPVSGSVSGPVSGNKEVNDAINRAEFAKLLAVAIGGESVSSYKCKAQVFPDVQVKAAYWYAPYICYLTDEDIMKGYPDGSFGPAKKVTRAEAAKIFQNAYFASGGGFGGLEPPSGNPYTDVSENAWYYQAVYDGAFAKWFDIKPWVGAKFYPGNTLSKGRAQLWINNFKKALVGW